MLHQDVRTLLDEAVPALPPSTVNPAEAVRRVAVIRRRRRTAMVSVAAVAVAVVAAVPAAISAVSGPSDRSVIPAGGRQFDPMVRTARVGWVPPTLDTPSWTLTASRQEFGGIEKGAKDGHGLSLTILASGEKFVTGAIGLPGNAVDRPTRPVNGRRAICLADPHVADSCSAVRWEYAPGAWARVSYSGRLGRTAAEAATVARRVAESVALDAHEPVRLPFRLTGPAASLGVTETAFSTPPGSQAHPWSVIVGLGHSRESRDGDVFVTPAVGISVLQRPASAGKLPQDGPPNASIGAHPARRIPAGLIVWGVNGTRVALDVNDSDLGAEEIYDHLHLVPNPNNYTTWTDRPLG